MKWKNIDGLQNQPVLVVIVVLLLVCAAPVILGTVVGLINFRDVGPESVMLLRIGDLVHSGRIYPNIDRPPYLVTLYGPIAYALFGLPYALAQAVGVDPKVPVRLAVISAFSICLVLIFLISRRLYKAGEIAWLSVLFAVSVPALSKWTFQIRPDFMAAAFSLTSLYLFLFSNSRRLPMVGAAICAALAVLVKQTFLAVPVTIICWHIYNRRYRDVVFWAACFALPVGAGYGLVLWREPSMLKHIAAILSPVLEYRLGLNFLLYALLQPVIPFAGAGGILVLWNRSSERLPILIYCVVAWLIAVLSIAQAGGDINYFWEPLMASAMLAGLGLWQLRKLKHIPLLASSVLVVLLLPATQNSWSFLVRGYHDASTYHVRREKWESFVATVSGRRLLSTLSDVTIHSKIPEIPDPFLNAVLEVRGRWNSEPIAAQIDAVVYDLIVIREGQAEDEGRHSYRGVRMWSERMWRALKRRYRPVCTFEGMEVWLPDHDFDETLLRNLSAIGCQARANLSSPLQRPIRESGSLLDAKNYRIDSQRWRNKSTSELALWPVISPTALNAG